MAIICYDRDSKSHEAGKHVFSMLMVGGAAWLADVFEVSAFNDPSDKEEPCRQRATHACPD